jgi:hypothetical protein
VFFGKTIFGGVLGKSKLSFYLEMSHTVHLAPKIGEGAVS